MGPPPTPRAQGGSSRRGDWRQSARSPSTSVPTTSETAASGPAIPPSNSIDLYLVSPEHWTPQTVEGIGQGPSEPRYTTANNRVVRNNTGALTYRGQPPTSDPGTFYIGTRPDSGYETKSQAASIPSTGFAPYSAGETQTLANDINSMDLRGDLLRSSHFPQAFSPYECAEFNEGDQAHLARLNTLICPGCGVRCKNQSDFKYAQSILCFHR